MRRCCTKRDLRKKKACKATVYQFKNLYTAGKFPHTCLVNPDAELHAKISAEVKQLAIADKNVPVNKIVEKGSFEKLQETTRDRTLPKVEYVIRVPYRYILNDLPK